MESIIITPKKESTKNAILILLKELNIDFTFIDNKEKPYNQEFVSKILESENQIKQGKTIKVKAEDLNNILGL